MSKPPTSTRSSDTGSTESTGEPEPLNITIGCEFEFVLAHLLNGQSKSRHRDNERGEHVVRETLAERLLVTCEVCNNVSSIKLC